MRVVFADDRCAGVWFVVVCVHRRSLLLHEHDVAAVAAQCDARPRDARHMALLFAELGCVACAGGGAGDAGDGDAGGDGEAGGDASRRQRRRGRWITRHPGRALVEPVSLVIRDFAPSAGGAGAGAGGAGGAGMPYAGRYRRRARATLLHVVENALAVLFLQLRAYYLHGGAGTGGGGAARRAEEEKGRAVVSAALQFLMPGAYAEGGPHWSGGGGGPHAHGHGHGHGAGAGGAFHGPSSALERVATALRDAGRPFAFGMLRRVRELVASSDFAAAGGHHHHHRRDDGGKGGMDTSPERGFLMAVADAGAYYHY